MKRFRDPIRSGKYHLINSTALHTKTLQPRIERKVFNVVEGS